MLEFIGNCAISVYEYITGIPERIEKTRKKNEAKWEEERVCRLEENIEIQRLKDEIMRLHRRQEEELKNCQNFNDKWETRGEPDLRTHMKDGVKKLQKRRDELIRRARNDDY
jgi:hypothetical protein